MVTGAMEAGAATAIGATGREAAGLATGTDGAVAVAAGAAVAVAIIGAAAHVMGLCTERDGCPPGGRNNRGPTANFARAS